MTYETMSSLVNSHNEYGLPVITLKREVYLDHAATTPVRKEVLDAMLPYFSTTFGNPSALYRHGREAKEAIARARKVIADIFGANTGEIIFTSGGTESNNLAIAGIVKKYKDRGTEIVISSFEHHAVLSAAEYFGKNGIVVKEVKVTNEGMVTPEALAAQLTPQTLLVSIMYANNEVGTVQDISALVKVVRDAKKSWGRNVNDPPFFHTDACQASGFLDLDVKKLGVDLMTVNGSKIYGPKGVGALFVRRGINLTPLFFGGGQENKMRSGTENVPAIVGFAEALRLAQAEKEQEITRLTQLRDYMITELFKRIPKIVLNGHKTARLPNNINVSILDIEGEAILLYLDEYGIAASTGSACDSQSLEPSHVILALGRPYEFAHGSMRFSLGRTTTKEDIDYVLEILPPICNVLRKISPIDVDITSHNVSEIAMKQAFINDGIPHFIKK